VGHNAMPLVLNQHPAAVPGLVCTCSALAPCCWCAALLCHGPQDDRGEEQAALCPLRHPGNTVLAVGVTGWVPMVSTLASFFFFFKKKNVMPVPTSFPTLQTGWFANAVDKKRVHGPAVHVCRASQVSGWCMVCGGRHTAPCSFTVVLGSMCPLLAGAPESSGVDFSTPI
jgi:hypothetical protein